MSDLPPPPSAREFVDGETVLYLGRQFRLKLVETKDKGYPQMWAGCYEVPVPPGIDGAARRQEVRRRLLGSLKGHADLYLPDRLAEICRRLQLEKPSIIVREQQKRWGSCDAKGTLRINWRIIQAPIPLIEYVLVHELAHRKNRDHDRAFWDAVRLSLPDYDERRRRLRVIGPQLVW